MDPDLVGGHQEGGQRYAERRHVRAAGAAHVGEAREAGGALVHPGLPQVRRHRQGQRGCGDRELLPPAGAGQGLRRRRRAQGLHQGQVEGRLQGFAQGAVREDAVGVRRLRQGGGLRPLLPLEVLLYGGLRGAGGADLPLLGANLPLQDSKVLLRGHLPPEHELHPHHGEGPVRQEGEDGVQAVRSPALPVEALRLRAGAEAAPRDVLLPHAGPSAHGGLGQEHVLRHRRPADPRPRHGASAPGVLRVAHQARREDDEAEGGHRREDGGPIQRVAREPRQELVQQEALGA
mmetsp:Transcript_137868/g.428422  ORF Transcript_137868/g.428422 Transcript_137868/m.428422 type:complete len:290 (-) Transcript_137868:625-1494(-)